MIRKLQSAGYRLYSRTPAKGENPVLGGHEVGISFSGICDGQGAELEAIALAGKRSLRLTATLKLMRPA